MIATGTRPMLMAFNPCPRRSTSRRAVLTLLWKFFYAFDPLRHESVGISFSLIGQDMKAGRRCRGFSAGCGDLLLGPSSCFFRRSSRPVSSARLHAESPNAAERPGYAPGPRTPRKIARSGQTCRCRWSENRYCPRFDRPRLILPRTAPASTSGPKARPHGSSITTPAGLEDRASQSSRRGVAGPGLVGSGYAAGSPLGKVGISAFP